MQHPKGSMQTTRNLQHALAEQCDLYARRPLLGLPLTQNHRRLRRQWCEEKKIWVEEWKEVVLTKQSSICVATPRWSDSSLETPWREDAEQLHYAPPHWYCIGYYGMGRYWIALSHSSSTHCRYFKQPALHHRGVGASCPSLPSGLGHSHAQRLTQITPSVATPHQL
ncbi:hypothetical protein TNCV_1326681 [Trichonephila clavipes]|nr:hypothetical protein TNCV_1326681 [Trichonephila clavipes]